MGGFYWINFRETDYYVPQEWHGDKPSKHRTSDEEFDELVLDYLGHPDEGYGRWLSDIFIGEFRERRKAQPNFTNMKEETKKKEDAKRKAEAKKRREKRKLTEKDLKGTYPKFDYYELLLVPNYASLWEIKAAYKQEMKRYHPDRNPKERKLAEKIAKKLNEAYDVLSNRTLRKKYEEEHRF